MADEVHGACVAHAQALQPLEDASHLAAYDDEIHLITCTLLDLN